MNDAIKSPPAWTGCILGELASKANSRRAAISRRTGKRMFIKSKKALSWTNAARQQLRRLEPIITVPVRFDLKIFYKDRRSDLDPALFFDAIQGFLIKNDRQVHGYRCRRFISKSRPRVDWAMWTL